MDIKNGVDYLAGAAHIGSAANYINFSKNGDVTFLKDAGLSFASIYGYDQAAELTISGTGIANKVQITSFATNGESNGGAATPDHTNDHITIVTPGRYWVMCNIAAVSGTGTGYEAGFSAFINNGDTQLQNIHAHRDLSGGGGDTGSITIAGIADLAAADTLEIWVWNEENTTNIIIDDITLSVLLIGGTT